MSFTVRPDGSIECSTLDEALQVRARVSGVAVAADPIANKPNGKSHTVEDWAHFTGSIRDQHKTILGLVKRTGGATIDVMASELRISTFALSGVLTSLKRIAKKTLGSDVAVLKRDQRGYGKARVVTYKAGPRLLAATDF
jgi:hypothetical protein